MIMSKRNLLKFFPLSYVARHLVTEITSDWIVVACAVKSQTVHFTTRKNNNNIKKTFQNTSVMKHYSLDVNYSLELIPDTNTIA